jgi:TPP-dependent pyruvate/acetoin dehydrogenase alpha subunit
MSYRSGHHSTSDDSSRYRTAGEMATWRARDPAARFRRLLDAAGWWDDAREAVLRQATRREARPRPSGLRVSERVPVALRRSQAARAAAPACHHASCRAACDIICVVRRK